MLILREGPCISQREWALPLRQGGPVAPWWRPRRGPRHRPQEARAFGQTLETL